MEILWSPWTIGAIAVFYLAMCRVSYVAFSYNRDPYYVGTYFFEALIWPISWAFVPVWWILSKVIWPIMVFLWKIIVFLFTQILALFTKILFPGLTNLGYRAARLVAWIQDY